MQAEDKNTPIEIAENTLDDISGGPHFRTWDPTRYNAKMTQHTGTAAGGASDTDDVVWGLMVNRE